MIVISHVEWIDLLVEAVEIVDNLPTSVAEVANSCVMVVVDLKFPTRAPAGCRYGESVHALLLSIALSASRVTFGDTSRVLVMTTTIGPLRQIS